MIDNVVQCEECEEYFDIDECTKYEEYEKAVFVCYSCDDYKTA
jgi:hypothetical protein